MAKMLVSLTPLRKHALLTALDEARLALKPEDVASFDVWAAAGLGQRNVRSIPAAFKIIYLHPNAAKISCEHLRFKLAQMKCADALGVSIPSSQSPQSPPASQQAKQAFTDSSDLARHWQLLFEFSVAADEFCSSEETGAS